MTDPAKIRRFEQNVLPHLDAAYNLARWLTCNAHDAEDVVQEACLRAFKFIDGFRGGNVRCWLLTIVRHTCYTWLKQNRPSGVIHGFDEETHGVDESGALPGMFTAPDNDPETLLSQHTAEKRLNQAIAGLPLEFREVLVLRELEDLSYKEIAGIAHIPIGTVMSRLARGRRLLQQSLVLSETGKEPDHEL